MSEWKPGDVAMVTARWVYHAPHSARRATRLGQQWESSNGAMVGDHEVSLVRPLVLIDPEEPSTERNAYETWDGLAAPVRVLSHGVTEGES